MNNYFTEENILVAKKHMKGNYTFNHYRNAN